MPAGAAGQWPGKSGLHRALPTEFFHTPHPSFTSSCRLQFNIALCFWTLRFCSIGEARLPRRVPCHTVPLLIHSVAIGLAGAAAAAFSTRRRLHFMLAELRRLTKASSSTTMGPLRTSQGAWHALSRPQLAEPFELCSLISRRLASPCGPVGLPQWLMLRPRAIARCGWPDGGPCTLPAVGCALAQGALCPRFPLPIRSHTAVFRCSCLGDRQRAAPSSPPPMLPREWLRLTTTLRHLSTPPCPCSRRQRQRGLLRLRRLRGAQG